MNISGQSLRSAMLDVPRLVTDWKNASMKAGWRFPEDWAHPAAELLAQACVEDLPLQDAVTRLGIARAYQGVGIRETMLDLGAFFRVVNAPVDDELMCSLVEAWVEENGSGEPSGCTDPSTGLATMAHLERILEDFSTGAASDRERLGLARVTLPLPAWERRPAWAMLADLGQSFQTEFAGVCTTAAINGSVMYILMPSTGTAGPTALARFLDYLHKDPYGPGIPDPATIDPLPGTPSEFAAVAAELKRPGPQ